MLKPKVRTENQVFNSGHIRSMVVREDKVLLMEARISLFKLDGRTERAIGLDSGLLGVQTLEKPVTLDSDCSHLPLDQRALIDTLSGSLF